MADKKPLIGLVPQIDEANKRVWMRMGYMDSIEHAGGVPVMLTLTTDAEALDVVARSLDGILFTGGGDIHPSMYGEEMLPECDGTNAVRDEMEKILLAAALKYDKPILGICRGCQMINVGLGGTLYQDLPSQKPSDICHRQEAPFEEPAHEADLVEGTPLKAVVGKDRIAVNTSHHQAVKDVAPGLKVMAVATDGVIESVYMPEKKFLWAVQWHPEYTGTTNPDSIALFKAFVDAAKE